MTQRNLSDFRAEWVSLCGKSDRLRGKLVCVRADDAHLCEALLQVLCNHGAEAGEEFQITLAETTATIAHKSGTLRLSFPSVYGVGLEFSSEAEMFVSDLFCAIVSNLEEFSLGEREISAPEKPLISYADTVRAAEILRAKPDRLFYDDLSYGGKLRDLQEAELQLLLEFDRICRENDITYFLGGGTLLGAVRHQGFIPWDDDIDVMMDRENFDRLSRIAPKAVGENFFYQNSTTDPNYHSPFHKLRAKNTLFVTEFSQRFEMEQGIFLDIFAHDFTSKRPKMRKIHIFLTTFVRSMVFHKWDESPMHFYGKKKFLCRIASFFVRHSSIRRLEKIERRVMTHYKNTGVFYDGMGEHLQHGGFDAKILQKKSTAIFEGHEFPVPADFDAYLRFSYGEDYMTLPRPSLRRAHHTAVQFSLGEKL